MYPLSITNQLLTESRTREHPRIQSDNKEQLTKDWNEEVEISVQYQADKKPFINIMLWFYILWDGHLGGIPMTKHHFELLQTDTDPRNSNLYWTCWKACEFGKTVLDRMVAENIIKSVKIELTAHIACFFTKDHILRLCLK